MIRATSQIFLFLLLTTGLQAQDRYMVFFKDKANSAYSISNPSAFLSGRAISRRLKNNVEVTEQDLPVNQNYVDAVAQLGVETYFTTRWMNGVLVQMDPALVDDVLAIPAVDEVEYVAPGNLLSPPPGARAKFEEDPISPPRISQQQYQMLGIDRMHEEGFMGEGVYIAIFDDGFANYTTLPAFAQTIQDNRIRYTMDFTRNRQNVDNSFSHGLRVFSILAADSEMIGAAPGASYMLSVTEAPGEYRVEEYNWLFAAEAADSAGVDIINTSLGYNIFNDAAMNYTVGDMDGQTTVITRAANIAASKGMLLVASAGNTGGSQWNIITAPADSESVLAVGAIDQFELLAAFSGRGPTADNRIKPDVVGLGVGTQLTTGQGAIDFQNGTSFSAPLITGLAAGLVQAFPDKTSAEVMDYIRMSGDRSETPDNFYGYGLPEFIRASQIADESLIPIADGVKAYPNPTREPYFTLTFSEAFLGQDIDAQVFNSDGELLNTYEFTPRLFENALRINLNSARTGLLLVRLISQAGVVTKKIILTH